MADLAELGDLPLQGGNLGTHDKRLGLDDSSDRVIDLATDGLVLRFQVEGGDSEGLGRLSHRRHSFDASAWPSGRISILGEQRSRTLALQPIRVNGGWRDSRLHP